MHRTTCILTASGNLPPPRPAILPQILQSMNQMNVAFRWRGTSKVMSRPLSPQDETTLQCTFMTMNKQHQIKELLHLYVPFGRRISARQRG